MEKYNASIRAIQMTDRIRKLPISPTGFPVPWFVAWIDGVPDFRVIRPNGIFLAHKRKICWICGEPLGKIFAMGLGPMCAINRTISEPPSHRECMIYAARACPFLANPRARRNTVDLPEEMQDAPGVGIKRNPGAFAVWCTRGYRPFSAGNGWLFTFGDPEEVFWFADGRPATRAEVEASIWSGMPLLEAEAEKEGPEAMEALRRMTADAMQYLPSA
jgi:hypothetical protein